MRGKSVSNLYEIADDVFVALRECDAMLRYATRLLSPLRLVLSFSFSFLFFLTEKKKKREHVMHTKMSTIHTRKIQQKSWWF